VPHNLIFIYCLLYWSLCWLKIVLLLNYHICCFVFILVSYLKNMILISSILCSTCMKPSLFWIPEIRVSYCLAPAANCENKNRTIAQMRQILLLYHYQHQCLHLWCLSFACLSMNDVVIMFIHMNHYIIINLVYILTNNLLLSHNWQIPHMMDYWKKFILPVFQDGLNVITKKTNEKLYNIFCCLESCVVATSGICVNCILCTVSSKPYIE
jgi:hypothetical protein